MNINICLSCTLKQEQDARLESPLWLPLTRRATQVPTMAWLSASAVARDKNPQICKAFEWESDIGGEGIETILACVIQNLVIKILNAADLLVQGNNKFQYKNTYCFGTQQLQTWYTFIYSTPLCFTLHCVTLQHILDTALHFTLHYITHMCRSGLISLFSMQVDEFKSCDTNMPSTRCHQATHTHMEKWGGTRILKDFITLIPTVSYKPTHGKTLQNENARCLKSWYCSTCLSCISCLRKCDAFPVSTTHHVELNETSVWNVIMDTSNHHNLTIPFDDMRFDAVEETVAAAPAALKTPMLVTSAQRDLL